MTAQQLDLALAEPALMDGVDAGDELIAHLLEQLPVVSPQRDIEAVAGRVAQRMSQFAGIPHDLLGYATDVDAGSSQAAHFDQQCSCPVVSRALGTGQTAAAAADHYQVIVGCHGVEPRVFDQSCTMSMLHRTLIAKITDCHA